MRRSAAVALAAGIAGAALVVGAWTDWLPDGARFLCKLALAVAAAVLLGGALVARLAGRERARQIGLGLALLAGFGLASLVAGEYAVRFALRDVSTTSDNSSYFALRWRRNHPPQLNSAGFREREYTPRPADGVTRIAVVGDSFTYGQGLEAEFRLTSLLEQRLAEHGVFEVLNFGRSGTETVDQVEILRDVVLDAHPDFVLLQWFVNDMEGRDKSGRPQVRRLLPSDILTSWLHRHSALFYLVNQNWARVQEALGLSEDYYQNLVRRLGDPASPSVVEARAALEEFFALCRERDIGVGMVLFPNLAGELGDDYPLGFLLDRVLETCAEHDVRCVDLRPVFAEVSPPKRLWASRLDAHPGRLANELTAQALLARFGPAFGLETTRRPGAAATERAAQPGRG